MANTPGTRPRAWRMGITLIASIFLAAACGGTTTPSSGAGSLGVTDAAPTATAATPEAPVEATGQIIFGNAEPPTAAYWDPAAPLGLVDAQVQSLVFDTLLAMNQDGSLGPSLATEWKRLSDLELQMTIRTDVKFHDGAPLTAEDIKAALERIGKPDSGLASALLIPPLTVQIDSPSQITIKTDKPFGPLENGLAVAGIVPKADVENPDNWKQRAMGSGPYKFVSYTGNDITFEANADYWGNKAKIKTVVLRYIEDVNARQNALLTGEVDMLTRVGPEQLKAVEGNADFTVNGQTPPSEIIMIYQHNGKLADLKLRQALAYAIDREAIAASLLGGQNPVPFSSLPTSMSPYYMASSEKFAYDPAKAKAMLAEAGYAGGLTLTMSTSTLVPKQPEIDQAIVDYLKAVGVTVEVTKLEVGAFRTTYNQYDLSLNTLGDFNNDPDFLLAMFSGGTGKAIFQWSDPKLDTMVAAQQAAVGDARVPLVQATSEYLWMQQPTLWLTDEVWYTIVSSRVKDYSRAPLIGEPLLVNASVTDN